MSNPEEGCNLHAACLVGPLVDRTRGVLECSIEHASILCIGNETPNMTAPQTCQRPESQVGCYSPCFACWLGDDGQLYGDGLTMLLGDESGCGKPRVGIACQCK